MFELVRIGPESVHWFRQIRLVALQSDPRAFSSTYARELQLTDEEWRERAASLDGRKRVGYFVMKAGEPCALVACFRDDEDHSRAQVISMWVAPEERRCGLASRLLEAARVWAQSQGVSTLRLFVTNMNHAAIALYRRSGFTETGRTEPYPNDAGLVEMEMERSTKGPIPRTGAAGELRKADSQPDAL